MERARAIAHAVLGGRTDTADVIAGVLQHIEVADPLIRAWVRVDGEGAAAAAGALSGRRGRDLTLAGVPVGVKDIMDVAGLPTTAGARPFAHSRPDRDAAVVARLRAAGAIILGKTATTEFAYLDPGPTRNPWNPDHTPGGSSSGSAAAVAAGMVPLALGTQTVGSVLRPAAYCGIVGFKPGYGWTSVEGIIPLSWSLDHVGTFTRDVADAALAHGVLATVNPGLGSSEDMPRLGIPSRFFRERAAAEVSDNVDAVASLLNRAGMETGEVPFPGADEWAAAGFPVLAAEAAAYHEAAFREHAAEYGPHLRSLIERGMAIAATDYVRAQRLRARLRERVVGLFAEVDALLLPVAPTTAPSGLASTGDSVFCAPASYAGLPAVSLPSGLGAGRLPLAIQLVGRPGGDADLLALATRVESALAFEAVPGP